MIYPTLEKIKSVEGLENYDIVPLMKEIYSDALTPIEVMRILKKQSLHCFLLESVEDSKNWGRYTFLGYQPKSEIVCHNGVLTIDGVQQNVKHPKLAFRKILEGYKSCPIENLPSFTGGLVGYFGYDYMKYSEPTLSLTSEDNEGFHDVDLMLFDEVICFDNFEQKIKIIVNISLNDLELNYQEGINRLNEIISILQRGEKAKIEPLELKSEFKALFSENEYCEMVKRAKHHIVEGDIFQVVLSNRIEASAKGSLFDVYRMLRISNPSPYMFYFSSDSLELAGASPETLVKKQGRVAYTYPLAGTRPRGNTKEEDDALEKELLSDEKELAEHNMLVDLGRNDLGRICEFGKVSVEEYMKVVKYSHVMHIGSTVRGIVREDKDAFDAIDAILPAGTLSGAPKIKAMEIIDQLENNKRGVYGGAIGYIDFTGNLDTCIAIRLVYKKNDKLFVRSGAGIVYDSVPKTEYQECINKAKAVMLSIEKVNGGMSL